MRFRNLIAISALLLFGSSGPIAGQTLNPEQQTVIAAWLRAHPGYRLAGDRDCACDEDIKTMRAGSGGAWKPVPDYHPYVASGDFNGDGVTDFAVVVIRSLRPHDFTLLVFDGPLDVNQPLPAFTYAHRDLARMGLFYGPPRPKPYRLVLGPFESEGLILQPKGGTYRFQE